MTRTNFITNTPGLPGSMGASALWSSGASGSALKSPAASAGALGRSQQDFASLLATDRARASSDASPETKAREAAADFVATALVEPIFKELRSSNQSAAPFAPGPAEKQFGGMLDAQFAQRITRGVHFPLVDRVAQLLLKKSAGTGTPGPGPKAEALPVLGAGGAT